MVRSSLIVVLAFAAILLIKDAMATDHTVGGPRGSWDEATNVQAWAKSQEFVTGDKLVFQYTPSHDVMEVSKADYDACRASNAILTDNSGASTIPLTKPGKRYFICGVPGHCASGMKMEINVVAKASSPALASTSPMGSPSASPAREPGPEGATAPFGSPFGSPSEGPGVSLSPPAPSSACRGNSFQPIFAFLVGAIVVIIGY